MIELNESMIGRKVVYRPPHLKPDEPGEEGVVTSVNEHFAFVRHEWSSTSKATSPQYLTEVTT